MKNTLFFTLHLKDCRWDYYKGSGKGGQKRNKTENCARCTHEDSNSSARSEEGRSKDLNKKKAFKRLLDSYHFNSWLRDLTYSHFGSFHNFKYSIEEDRANFYDLGEERIPLRKKKKRLPVIKSKTKALRQESKKITDKYKS
tara:strand:- start:9451 stop:9876 length:426 start_codon:yes stop_codon:yes gene_type:complete